MRSNHTRFTAGRVIHSSLRLYPLSVCVCFPLYFYSASGYSLFFPFETDKWQHIHNHIITVIDSVCDWNVCVRFGVYFVLIINSNAIIGIFGVWPPFGSDFSSYHVIRNGHRIPRVALIRCNLIRIC